MQKKLSPRAIVIGITGGVGSGKSTVAKMFKASGAIVIDADAVGHRVIKKNSPEYRKIVKAFGIGVLQSNKEIDRPKLAGIVFKDKRALAVLNSITHPAILKLIRQRIKMAGPKPVIVDAPLLMETGLDSAVDWVVLVKASLKNRFVRIQKSRKGLKKDIIRRIHSQMPEREKAGQADFIIHNNGTLEETRKQVEQLRRLWWRK
ncbi:MAG: dephospho-CoA kinase [Candidatus Omnitrophica bacterium]|nr:dephospho-CoA kinase [Candidatus Omnitrophota bacterium]